MDKLNTSDLVNSIAEKTGITKTDTELLVRNIIELIEEGLRADGAVKVKGLGTFKLKRVARRMGRNLQTGEQVEIPPHNKVTFTPESDLKDLVNKDYQYLTYKEAPVEKGWVPPSSAEKKEEPVKEEIKEETPVKSESEDVKAVPEKEEATPEPPPPATPEPPKEEPREEYHRRRYLWVIPVAIIIIAILAVIFYFRACHDKEEEVKPPSEQIITPADEPEETTITPVDTIPEEPAATEPAEPEIKEPQPPETSPEEDLLYALKPGNYLYQLAGQFYGDSLFWVIIYKANASDIEDPEGVSVGKELIIPALEGDRFNLSRADSMNLSEGYRMLYEYYMVEEDPRTSNFYFGMMRYMPR